MSLYQAASQKHPHVLDRQWVMPWIACILELTHLYLVWKVDCIDKEIPIA